MNGIRRLAFPLRLAWARLVDRAERVAIVCLGIAAGAAILGAVLAGSLAARDRSLQQAAARIAPVDRTVRTVWVGVPGQNPRGYGALDRVVRRTLRDVAPARPVTAMLLRETSFGGHVAELGAIDGVAPFVHVRSGRLPRRCAPARCEVLQLGASDRPLPTIPGLRLVRVGRATLASEVPFGASIASSKYAEATRYHTAPAPPFLVAQGVAGLARAAALDGLYRSYVWALPIAPRSVHPWSVGRFGAAVTRARSQLGNVSDIFDVTAPTDELAAAADTGRAAGRRMLLLGGEAAALLLAFTILAAASLRRDVEAAWRRLTWFGARRWQLVAFSAAESGALALVGTAAGWAGGTALALVLARRLGSPGGTVLAHSALSWRGLALALGLALASTLVLLVTLRARGVQVGGLSVSAVDVAALGALLAIGLALATGTAGAEDGSGLVLVLLPGLIAFVAAVACARVLAPTLRALERLGRRGPISLRLGALSLARNGGQATIAVTFLVVSLGLALFAETYRSTLARGQADQARYAVPADFVLREDLTKLVPVLDAAPLPAYRAAGARATPVLRLPGDVSRLESSAGFTLLGLPARSLPGIYGWRSDFSRLSRERLATRIAFPRAALRGARLPRSAGELVLPAVVHGDTLAVTASVETRRGDFVGLDLGTTGARPLRAQVPGPARGGRLVALAFAVANTGLHGVPNGGANVNPVARGTMRLGPLRAGGRTIPLAGWIGTNGVSGDVARLRYAVTNEVEARFRARQPTDGRPVPVLATPVLAAAAGRGGILPIQIAGRPLRVRVAAVVRRFPSISGDAIVGDRDAISTALNADAPGAAVVDELWLRAARPRETETALGGAPFNALALDSLRAREHELRSEPLARGALLTLAGASLAALALALVGLLLGLVGDLRDETGELYDLETQGAEPRLLRRHLRLRTLAVAAFGLAGGLATGAILSALVVDLVRVTANAEPPEPPLVLTLSAPVAAAAIAGYALLAAALVAAATGRAFRARAAGRLSEVA
jgi:hypothetical protein